MILRVVDFSETPGGRYRDEGDYSGEWFRESFLKPLFLQSREIGEDLLVDLDGTYGYSTGFLEEAFGGLARELGPQVVAEGLTFVSTEEPFLLEEIQEYIWNW